MYAFSASGIAASATLWRSASVSPGLAAVITASVTAVTMRSRRAWGSVNEPNVKNGAGLPTPSFRTDDWPPVSAEK